MKPRHNNSIIIKDVPAGPDLPALWQILHCGKVIYEVAQEDFTIWDMIAILHKLGLDAEMKREPLA